jgi:excisionase family DNA binding protein
MIKTNNIDLGHLNRKAVFSIDELAAYTGISKSTIYKYTMEGSIPSYKRGKFNFYDRKEIIKWLKEFPVEQQNIPSGYVAPPGSISIDDAKV